MSTATQAWAPVITRACRDAIPVVLAYAPFGLALGATLAATHIPPLIAWSSSPLLFSGAAQLLAVQLPGAGASAGVVVLGALVVNARMLLTRQSGKEAVGLQDVVWIFAGGESKRSARAARYMAIACVG